MTLEDFLEKLKNNPQGIEFDDTMSVIESHYNFTPVAFNNGNLQNQAGENQGSCKLFAFARVQGLNEQETLYCFGQFYRVDVLANPEGDSHQNIRNFMKTGWNGIHFDAQPLTAIK